jgi:acyl-CoA thioesterase FadM
MMSPYTQSRRFSRAKAMSNAFSLIIAPAADDIDELGHVNNAVWVRWIQDVATAHWNAAAAPERVATFVWVVVRHEIDYLGNVGAGEAVTARVPQRDRLNGDSIYLIFHKCAQIETVFGN